ncbi:DUF2599 domain-containing protein [Pseudomonas wayambapalatensis]|uniref:DUF2599 domain-containing protein n=1 Tax=Pseudomonas wayambapalatensis TaxID=485895 RepID=UPI003CFB7E78
MYLPPVLFRLSLLAASLVLNHSALAAPGPETAHALSVRYLQSPPNCGSTNKPRFLCAGVILKGTTHMNQENSWDPTPEERENGGTAYTYLAKDATFSHLALNDTNGYIIYPAEQQPKESRTLQLLCFFPVDGGRRTRSDHGCGESQEGGASSRACHLQDITTAKGWLANYGNDPAKQCGFSVANGMGLVAVNGFNAGVEATGLLPGEQNNELRGKTWEGIPPAHLPIQAFFYLHDSPQGLLKAQQDQRQFYKATGTFVPIITLTLPEADRDALFNYVEASQAKLGDVICERYFVSGHWFERSDVNPGKKEWALGLVPTDCARAVKANPSEEAENAADREMRDKFSADQRWVNNDKGGMTQQMVCHMRIAHDKPEWNLEPFRPNLPLEDYLRKGCNPR